MAYLHFNEVLTWLESMSGNNRRELVVPQRADILASEIGLFLQLGAASWRKLWLVSERRHCAGAAERVISGVRPSITGRPNGPADNRGIAVLRSEHQPSP